MSGFLQNYVGDSISQDPNFLELWVKSFKKMSIQLILVKYSCWFVPGIHDEVDDGVDGRVGHGHPEE